MKKQNVAFAISLALLSIIQTSVASAGTLDDVNSYLDSQSNILEYSAQECETSDGTRILYVMLPDRYEDWNTSFNNMINESWFDYDYMQANFYNGDNGISSKLYNIGEDYTALTSYQSEWDFYEKISEDYSELEYCPKQDALNPSYEENTDLHMYLMAEDALRGFIDDNGLKFHKYHKICNKVKIKYNDTYGEVYGVFGDSDSLTTSNKFIVQFSYEREEGANYNYSANYIFAEGIGTYGEYNPSFM